MHRRLKPYLAISHVTPIILITALKNKIKTLRAERKWSQAELAQKVGVSRNSINSIENGRFDPSLPLAFDIAHVFGVKIEDIFERERPSAQGNS